MGTLLLTHTGVGAQGKLDAVIWRFLVAISERAVWGDWRWPGRGSVY